MTFNGPDSPAIAKWEREHENATRTSERLARQVAHAEAKLTPDRRDTAMVNINSKSRWQALDSEVMIRANLTRDQRDLSATRRQLDHLDRFKPQPFTIEDLQPGRIVLVNGNETARIAKVNRTTITDTDGFKHRIDRIWFIAKESK